MKKYNTFDEMFNDDECVSPEEREQINFQVVLIGKKGTFTKRACRAKRSKTTSHCK